MASKTLPFHIHSQTPRGTDTRNKLQGSAKRKVQPENNLQRSKQPYKLLQTSSNIVKHRQTQRLACPATDGPKNGPSLLSPVRMQPKPAPILAFATLFLEIRARWCPGQFAKRLNGGTLRVCHRNATRCDSPCRCTEGDGSHVPSS